MVKHKQNMKNNYLKCLYAVVVVAMTILGISCDKQGLRGIKFPAKQNITCNAGETASFSFSANTAWKLSSDALWCQFVTPAGDLQETAGVAGTHTITLRITDVNLSNDTTKATITIWMGGKSSVVAEVERGAKELYLKLYDAEGKETNSLALGYDEYIATTIKANFRYAAMDIPEWIEVAERDADGKVSVTNSIAGDANEGVEVLLRIVKDGSREAKRIALEDNMLISFMDKDRSVNFEYPITYLGMGDDKLTFVAPTESYYGWEVSLDGKTFRYNDDVSGTTTTFEDELKYKITAQDNDYAILLLEQHIDRGMLSFECFDEGSAGGWIEFDKEDGILRVNEHGGYRPRYGVVMALPRSVYRDFKSDASIIFDDDTSSGIVLPCIKSDYTEYILIDFVQYDLNKANQREGMYAYHSLTSLEIYCDPYTDASLTEKYGVEDIYICDFVNPVEGKAPGIIVNPLIDGWDVIGYEAGVVSLDVVMGDRNLKMSEGEFYVGENTDEELSVHLWGPKDGWNEDNVVIIFKVNDIAKKILVVTPPSI